MSDSEEILAWRSGKGAGDLYTASDLQQPERVKEIFAACHEAQGYVTADGWRYLFKVWKGEGILELDRDTGWFHSGRPEESAAHLFYQSLMAGYNPLSGEKGDYDPDSGLFLSLEGRKQKIDWEEIIGKSL